jgi:hypothetical protein
LLIDTLDTISFRSQLNVFDNLKNFLPYMKIYFGVMSVTMSLFLYDERRYLAGETEAPEEMSFIGNTPSEFGACDEKFLSMINSFGR